jgi:hypothetical protein
MPLTDVALQGLALRGLPTQTVGLLDIPAVHTSPIIDVKNAPLTATLKSPHGQSCSMRGTSEAEPEAGPDRNSSPSNVSAMSLARTSSNPALVEHAPGPFLHADNGDSVRLAAAVTGFGLATRAVRLPAGKWMCVERAKTSPWS